MPNKRFVNTAKRIISNEYVQNAATLLTGNIAGQAISLLIYPFLTRMFTPDDFGLYNLFLSIGGLLILFGTGSYQYSIVIAKNDSQAKGCFQISLIINVILFILLVFSNLFAKQIACIFNEPKIEDVFYLLPIFVFFGAMWPILNYWFIREKKFRKIASYQVCQNFSNSLFKSLFGIFKTCNGLIIGQVIGFTVAAIVSFIRLGKSTIKNLLTFNWAEILWLTKKHFRFPVYNLPKNVINFLSGNIPILVLTAYFSLSEVGLFGMAIAIAHRPISLLVHSLYQTFYQQTSDLYNKKQEIRHNLYSYLKKIIPFTIIGLAIIYMIVPELAAFIFGEVWYKTGIYIRLMMPWLAATLIFYPLDYLPDILVKQKGNLVFEIISISLRTIALVIGCYYKDCLLSIALYSLASTVLIIARGIWYIYIAKQFDNSLIKDQQSLEL